MVDRVRRISILSDQLSIWCKLHFGRLASLMGFRAMSVVPMPSSGKPLSTQEKMAPPWPKREQTWPNNKCYSQLMLWLHPALRADYFRSVDLHYENGNPLAQLLRLTLENRRLIIHFRACRSSSILWKIIVFRLSLYYLKVTVHLVCLHVGGVFVDLAKKQSIWTHRLNSKYFLSRHIEHNLWS